jgi:hypothetical protein
MGSFSTTRVENIMRDITRLQKDIADISRDEARESGKIARATSSLSSTRSPSSAANFQRDIERAQKALAGLQSRRASKASDLARKQADLGSAQNKLMREQQADIKKSHDIITKMEREARQREHDAAMRAFDSISTKSSSDQDDFYTAFISHASEDKDDVARPLAEVLIRLGHRVWFDEFTLKVGDSLRRTIDRGLGNSRFGIVILSPSFFAKNWPQYELDGMVARENTTGQKVVLPIWHKVSKNEVLRYSHTLADRVALSTAMHTIEELAARIHEVLDDAKG